MKKKLIASSLAVAAVTGLLPANVAMAATTVSASTDSVIVASTEELISGDKVFTNTSCESEFFENEKYIGGNLEIYCNGVLVNSATGYVGEGSKPSVDGGIYAEPGTLLKIKCVSHMNRYGSSYSNYIQASFSKKQCELLNIDFDTLNKTFSDKGTAEVNQTFYPGIRNTIKSDLTSYLYIKMPEEVTTIPITAWGGTVEVTLTPQTFSDITKDYISKCKASLLDYNPNNNTSSNDLLNYIKSKVTMNDVTPSLNITNITKATDLQTGKITGNITITNNNDSSIKTTEQFSIIIPKLPQSVQSVFDSYNKVINKLSVSNNTKAEDIINTVNITNSNIKVSIDNFKVQKATDSAVGKVTGTLKITDGSTTKTIPLNLTINKLAQSLNTAKNNVTSVLGTIRVNNDTTEESIRNAIAVTLDTSVISVNIKDFNKSLATENSKGEITGTVVLSDSTSNVEIPINFGISQLPQSIETVKNLFEKQLNKFVATNETTAEDILGSIYIANSDIHAEMKEFNLTEAKEEEKGTVTGSIILTDGKTEIEVSVNLEIADLPQTLATAVSKIQNVLNGEVVSNETIFKDLLDNCKDVVSNPNIDIYISPDEKAEKVPSTEFSNGSMTGTMIVTDGKTEVKVPINLTIEKLPATENGIKDKVEDIITNTDVTNDTTKEDLENKIKDELGDGFDVNIDPFEKEPSTSDEDGKITGNVIVTPIPSGEDVQPIIIPIEIPIEKLPQTLEEVRSKIQASLDSFIATNDTKAKDVLAAVRTNDIDDNMSINFGIESGETFKLTPATETEKGLITGVIYVSNGEDEITIDVNKIISELAQTVQGAKDHLNVILPTLRVTNDTTQEDLKELLQNSVESNISVDIKDFDKVLATMDSDGKITSTVILSDINTGENLELPLELKIDKLSLTLDEAKHRIEVDLSDIQVTNDTTKEELEEKISKKLNDQFDITVNNFTKQVSTALNIGKVTGDVVIKEKDSENKADVSVELTIAKLSQAIDEAKESIRVNLDKLVVSNDTTKEDLEGQIKSLVGDNINVTINDFNKTPSTTKQKGAITGTLNLADKNNGSTAEFPINLTIAQLKSQSSGGSSGGGSGSSGSSSSSDREKADEDNTLTNEDTRSIENNTTGWRNENGAWHYYDSTGKVLVGWQYINGLWYYFNTDGVLQTGWQQISGLWYYLNPNPGQTLGAMKTGWLNDNGIWYYLNQSGAMQTGWCQIDGVWYYLESSGAMKTGWLNDNGTWYYLNQSGAMQIGWQQINGIWYYLNPVSDGYLGAMKIGWYQDTTGTWYYSYSDGAMAHDTVIDGYTLGSNGAWIN